MPTISGNIVFDRDRSKTINPGDSFIQGVSVVLQNTASLFRVTCTTDANGLFIFQNVPAGNYYLIEAFDEPAGPNPANWANAAAGATPSGSDPTINLITNPPQFANAVDSITPNTLTITVGAEDITGLLFLDGPVIYSPITDILDSCSVIGTINYITAANNGTIGSFPAGTATNTGAPGTAANPPYPGVTPGFTYVQPNPFGYTPIGGEYTIQNIMDANRFITEGAWWVVSDHTTGDETGRMMIVNGANPGSIVFQQTVSVSPNSFYLFTTWIMNVLKIQANKPMLGVIIIGNSGQVLYQENLENDLPSNPYAPEWKEIGTVFNSQNNNTITVKFTSQGPEQGGNDYAIDDIALMDITVQTFPPVKSVSSSFVAPGEPFTYTTTINDTCDNPLTNVTFIDTMPPGITFIPGTVKIGGISQPTYDPQVGFAIPNIPGNSSQTITFQAVANGIPNPNPAINTSSITYSYTPVIGGISTVFTFDSNEVPVTVNGPLLNPTKTVDKSFVDIGDVLTYTVTATNTGNQSATSVVLTDPVPNGTKYVAGSLTSNVPVTGTPDTQINLTNPLNVGDSINLTYKVIVDAIPNPNPIPNTATFTFKYTVNPDDPNGETGTEDTNTVTTQVNNAQLKSIKSVDKAYANPGDTLTYTLEFTNTGSIDATNVVITDAIAPGTTFVPGSITSTIPFTGTSIETGLALNNPIVPGSSVVITYKVLVGNTVPNPNPIPNTASSTFKYTVNPDIPDGASGTSTTNTINTLVSIATLNGIKSVDKSNANVGDTLTYTLTFTNSGNVDANNVVITDVIPAGTTFVGGSITSTIPFTGASPETGLTLLAPVPAGSNVVITYKVLVGVNLPNPNPIPNTGTSVFTFTTDPNNPNGSKGNGTTNTVTTQVSKADLISSGNFIKSVDKTNATIGDVIKYTLTITNTGNTAANNVVVKDILPNGTAFVPGSIVSSVPFTGADPVAGITLTNPVLPGDTVTINYSATITALPVPNPIVNTADVTYTYTSDPDTPNSNTATGTSTPAITQVNIADLISPGNFIKSVDKSVDKVGDILTYTLTVKNTGNTNADNVIVTDPIPNGTTFVPGSVTVSVPFTGNNPETGIKLTNSIAPNEVITLTYKVTVVTIPVPNPIPNTGIVDYTYVADPNNPVDIPQNGTSNTVETLINQADISSPGNLTKVGDKSFADIGDIVTYTITAKNTGNVSANNVVIKDALQPGTQLVAGSVTSNVAFTGSNPATGITLTNPVEPGQSVTVTYKVKVVTVPTPNPIANIATVDYTFTTDPANPNSNTGTGITDPFNTQVNTADLLSPGNFIKSVDKIFANIGDTLTYTLDIKNTGNVAANNVLVTDPIPNGTTFVSGSITSTSPFTGTNPATGITLTNSIQAGQAITITYQVKVVGIPVPNPIPNTADISYNYTSDPSVPNGQSASGNSNTVDTIVNIADLSSPGNTVKSVDKPYAQVGDTLTYTINMKNTGNVPADNIVVTDALQPGTQFLPGSITSTIPFTGTDLATGITLTNSIQPGQLATVTYKVTVISLPVPNPILNIANVDYTYISDPQNPTPTPATTQTTPVPTTVNQADLVSSGNFVKSVDKANAKVGDIVKYTVTIKNTGNAPANNIVVDDILPNGTTFVTGSIVSSVPFTGTNPTTGITLTNPIQPGGSITISYSATITSLPVPNPIVNTADITYTYTSDPENPDGITVTGTSTPATTQVNLADLISPGNFVKSVDKTIDKVGDVLTYTLTVKNTGNTNADNVVITDPMPNGTQLVPGSVTVSVPFTGISPATGLSLTNPVAPNETVTITYKVTVISLPVPNPIPNTGTVNYTFIADPKNPVNIPQSGNSNTVETLINYADITSPGNLSKVGDKAFADVGDVITYTITAKNTGNVDANNVVIKDILQPGTQLVSGSVTASVPFTGTNPATGITFTNPVGPNQSVTLSYKVMVVNIPVPNPIVNIATVDYTFTTDPTNPNSNTGTGTSNPFNTQVNTADLLSSGNFVKSVDKIFADIGDTITYTLTVKNTGNVAANNILVTDPIQNGTNFVPGSITSSVPFIGANLVSGITLINPLQPNESVTITYKVKVVTTPNPNPIPNKANVAYSYTSDPSVPNGENASGDSNTVETTVNNANLSSPGNTVKSVDKPYAKVGDILTYTINMKNTGNIPADNVSVKDALQPGTQFITGSITSTIPFIGTDLATGITLTNSIQPGQTATVTYQVRVISVPTPNPIVNVANVDYSYIVDPQNPVSTLATAQTLPVPTQVNNADISSPTNFKKSVDKAYATIGDTLTYTITATNTGNVDANNVVITDALQPGTQLIAGSVTSNVAFTGNNPATGITLTNHIKPGDVVTITYQVKVISLPDPSTINNIASINYTFTVDPANPNGESASYETPPAKTIINYADLVSLGNLIKSADTDFAAIGSTITYTITAKNTGNVDANNVVIKDALQLGVEFVANSITSSVAFTGNNIVSGITLVGPVKPGDTVTVTFKALVTNAVEGLTIDNTANINYNYTVDPANPNGSSTSGDSNTVTIGLYDLNYTVTKTSDKSVVQVGDTFNYTITLKNDGNIDINDVMVTDKLSSAFEVQQIRVNGTIVQGNLVDGINVGTLEYGSTIIVLVTVKAIASTNGVFKNTAVASGTIKPNPDGPEIPVIESGTDEVGVTSYNTTLNLKKSANKKYAVVGEVVTYTVVATNMSDVVLGIQPQNPVVVYDTLPSNLAFVEGSVKINGVPYPDLSINQGVDLGQLGIGQSKTISFDAKVLSSDISPINNMSSATYSYQLPGQVPQLGTSNSNKVSLIPEVANIEIIKTADKESVSLRNKITYTVMLINNGTLDAKNVIFYDNLPSGVTLVSGSFKVDGVVINSVDLEEGVYIGNIPKGTSKEIEYTVTVVAANCSMKLVNSVYVEFNYTLLDGSYNTVVSAPTETSVSNVNISITNFKQFSIEKDLQIPAQKPSIESINTTDSSIEIVSYHVAQTAIGKSIEGQYITGNKLIINGLLNLTIEYTACEATQSVHSAHYSLPFSTFIVLPECYCIGNKLEVDAIVEDVYNNVLDCRRFFANATVLINVKLLNCSN